MKYIIKINRATIKRNPDAGKTSLIATGTPNQYHIKEQIIQAIKDEVVKAIADGKTLLMFKDEIDKIFDNASLTRLEPHNIENIFDTSLSSAAGARDWDNLHSEGVRDYFTYYRWVTLPDACPQCLAMEGKIFSADDPGWIDRRYPLHDNCRCYIDPMTADEVVGQEISKLSDMSPPMEGFGSPGTIIERNIKIISIPPQPVFLFDYMPTIIKCKYCGMKFDYKELESDCVIAGDEEEIYCGEICPHCKRDDCCDIEFEELTEDMIERVIKK
jgi:SPP1 gp7 family putative phage head morphogenesis protein